MVGKKRFVIIANGFLINVEGYLLEMGKSTYNRKKLPPEDMYKTPEEYYQGEVLEDYTRSKSLMRIQERITKRALRILGDPAPNCLILDMGMGCGFSTSYLFLNNYNVVGIDLIYEMLTKYKIPELNPVNGNIKKLPFRSKSFDYIISISALQWIINKLKRVERARVLKDVAIRIDLLLKRKGKAVFQFYSVSSNVMREIGAVFADNGHFGEESTFIIDNPNSSTKRKTFLYLKKE